MKYLFFLLFISVSLTEGFSQLKPGQKSQVINMPEGTALTKGEVKVLPGYKAFVSEKDKNIIHIQRADNYRTSRGSNITGSFSCKCSDTENAQCGLRVENGSVVCIRLSCKKCSIEVVLKPSQGLALTTSTRGVRWTKIMLE
jgi:hypothetical protein